MDAGEKEKEKAEMGQGFHLESWALVGTSKQAGLQELDKNLEVVISQAGAHKSRCQPRTELKAPRAAILTKSERQCPRPSRRLLCRGPESCLFKTKRVDTRSPPSLSFLFPFFLSFAMNGAQGLTHAGQVLCQPHLQPLRCGILGRCSTAS